MTNRIDHGGVYVPPNAKILSAELSRMSDILKADRATMNAAILGNTAFVLSGLALAATGTGLQVQVATGEGVDGNGVSIYVPSSIPSTAVPFGLPAEGYAPTATLAAADPTNPRIDLVCLRANTILTDYGQLFIYNGSATTQQALPQTKMAYFQVVTVTGTPSATPSAPALSQATDLLIAQVAVAAGATTLSGANITDKRSFLSGSARIGTANTWTAAQTFNAAINQAPGVSNSTPFEQFGDVWNDYVVSGLLPPTGASLTVTVPTGVAYALGQRIIPAATSTTLPASKDNYLDVSNTGAFTVTSVTNGAGAPAIAANSIRLAMLVTSGTAITAVSDLRTLSLSTKPTLNLGLGAVSTNSLADLYCSAGAGLVLNYSAGIVDVGANPIVVTAGTLTLTASATNYVFVTPLGSVTFNTTGFPVGGACIPLALVTTGVGSITLVSNRRAFLAANNINASAGARQSLTQANNAGFLAIGTGLAVNLLATAVALRANVAAGANDYGAIDYPIAVGADVVGAWSALTASSTLYLYIDRNTSTGALTYGFSALAPVTQPTAPSSPTTDQHWFDTSLFVMKRWNGAAWVVFQRIFVGQCVTNGTNVTSVTPNGINSPTVPQGTQNGQVVTFDQFASSKTGNGYVKLPNGLIIQWFTSAVTAYTASAPLQIATTLPIAFPNGILWTQVGILLASSTVNMFCETYSSNATSVTAAVAGATTQSVTVTGFAIGY